MGRNEVDDGRNGVDQSSLSKDSLASIPGLTSRAINDCEKL